MTPGHARSPDGRGSPMQRTSQRITPFLALPSVVPTPLSEPPPLPALSRLPRDTSMLYGIGSVDASGRIASREILSALRWMPGDTVDLILDEAIILRASPNGQSQVPKKPAIVIPAAARRRYQIRTGSHVLLAAAPEFKAVIAYPLSALDDMIVSYHSARTPAEPGEHA